MVTDLRTKKIPNALTFPAAVLAIALQTVEAGPAGALSSIEGWILGIAIMLATKILGYSVGGGDVKLFAAIGAFLGPSMIFLVFFFFCLSFMFVAWGRLLSAFPWRPVLLTLPLIVSSKNMAVWTSLDWSRYDKARKSPLLFGPFYAVGTLGAILLKEPALRFMGFIK